MKLIRDPKDRYLGERLKSLNAITEVLKKQVEDMDENGMRRQIDTFFLYLWSPNWRVPESRKHVTFLLLVVVNCATHLLSIYCTRNTKRNF